MSDFVRVAGNPPSVARVTGAQVRYGRDTYDLEDADGKDLWAFADDTTPLAEDDPDVGEWIGARLFHRTPPLVTLSIRTFRRAEIPVTDHPSVEDAEATLRRHLREDTPGGVTEARVASGDHVFARYAPDPDPTRKTWWKTDEDGRKSLFRVTDPKPGAKPFEAPRPPPSDAPRPPGVDALLAALDVGALVTDADASRALSFAQVRNAKTVLQYDDRRSHPPTTYVFTESIHRRKAVNLTAKDVADLIRGPQKFDVRGQGWSLTGTWWADWKAWEGALRRKEEAERGGEREDARKLDAEAFKARALAAVPETDPRVDVYRLLVENVQRDLRPHTPYEVFEGNRPGLRERGRVFLHRILTKTFDEGALDYVIRPDNKGSRQFFTRVTGVELPPTQKGSRTAVEAWLASAAPDVPDTATPLPVEPLAPSPIAWAWIEDRTMPSAVAFDRKRGGEPALVSGLRTSAPDGAVYRIERYGPGLLLSRTHGGEIAYLRPKGLPLVLGVDVPRPDMNVTYHLVHVRLPDIDPEGAKAVDVWWFEHVETAQRAAEADARAIDQDHRSTDRFLPRFPEIQVLLQEEEIEKWSLDVVVDPQAEETPSAQALVVLEQADARLRAGDTLGALALLGIRYEAGYVPKRDRKTAPVCSIFPDRPIADKDLTFLLYAVDRLDGNAHLPLTAPGSRYVTEAESRGLLRRDMSRKRHRWVLAPAGVTFLNATWKRPGIEELGWRYAVAAREAGNATGLEPEVRKFRVMDLNQLAADVSLDLHRSDASLLMSYVLETQGMFLDGPHDEVTRRDPDTDTPDVGSSPSKVSAPPDGRIPVLDQVPPLLANWRKGDDKPPTYAVVAWSGEEIREYALTHDRLYGESGYRATVRVIRPELGGIPESTYWIEATDGPPVWTQARPGRLHPLSVALSLARHHYDYGLPVVPPPIGSLEHALIARGLRADARTLASVRAILRSVPTHVGVLLHRPRAGKVLVGKRRVGPARTLEIVVPSGPLQAGDVSVQQGAVRILRAHGVALVVNLREIVPFEQDRTWIWVVPVEEGDAAGLADVERDTEWLSVADAVDRFPELGPRLLVTSPQAGDKPADNRAVGPGVGKPGKKPAGGKVPTFVRGTVTIPLRRPVPETPEQAAAREKKRKLPPMVSVPTPVDGWHVSALPGLFLNPAQDLIGDAFVLRVGGGWGLTHVATGQGLGRYLGSLPKAKAAALALADLPVPAEAWTEIDEARVVALFLAVPGFKAWLTAHGLA